MNVIKRNGEIVEFDKEKLESVINKVFGEFDNIYSSNIVEDVINEMESFGDNVTTEELNDELEHSFMRNGLYDEAKAFILHRDKNKKVRGMSAGSKAMSEYIFMNRYARHNTIENRRETWDEAVDRVRDMHTRKYPSIKSDIDWAFEQVREKRVLPSMRSMQFAGFPIENNHARMYNCSYGVADRVEFFSEAIYLLLCGCGVGFSVEFDNVKKIPPMVEPDMKVIRHVEIEDSIEGWANSIKELMNSYVYGYTVEFVYKNIRVAGAKIKSGGNAPGHVPLRRALEKIRVILDGAVGRNLKPIEAYDIVMHSADAVLSGGVRRSACICMFSADDVEMSQAKTGNWFDDNPQRGRSNNSVKLLRDETSKEQFMRIFEHQKEFGEPGFYFVDDLDHGSNPCVEIGLNPFLTKENGEKESGFCFCNLTSINGKMLKTIEDFKIAVKASAIIGTCQAGYTDFKYVKKTTREITEREALLGMSITGMMDSPKVALNPDYQKEMAKYAIEVNKEYSSKIGINQAARITCVKPEGSTSVLLDTASGIHPRYAPKYLRRIQANVNDPVYKHFKEKNPHACEASVWSNNGTDDVVTFCVKAPEDAIFKDSVSAIVFLEIVKMTQTNWVLEGTARPESSRGLTHNVSNTITVKESEWDDVADYIYENRHFFTGISLLADNGDTTYQQAPHQQIRSNDDELMFNNLLGNYQAVDYTTLFEEDDNTKLSEAIACGGGACELK